MLERLALWLLRKCGTQFALIGPNVWLDADDDKLTDIGKEIREKVRAERLEALHDELNRLGILWISQVDKSRLHIGGDAIERAIRWEAFYREEGGLADLLAGLRKEAFEAAQEAKADDDVTRHAWMLQDRAYRQLDNRICSVIATGKALQKQIEETGRIPLRVAKSV